MSMDQNEVIHISSMLTLYGVAYLHICRPQIRKANFHMQHYLQNKRRGGVVYGTIKHWRGNKPRGVQPRVVYSPCSDILYYKQRPRVISFSCEISHFLQPLQRMLIHFTNFENIFRI